MALYHLALPLTGDKRGYHSINGVYKWFQEAMTVRVTAGLQDFFTSVTYLLRDATPMDGRWGPWGCLRVELKNAGNNMCWASRPWFDYIEWSIYSDLYVRRKFRSETSDNMDSWKAEVRRVRREKIRRKKMQMREKVGKSRNTVFFQWFGAPVGRKVGSLKRRVRSQLARWEMKKCTPLWREAHFEVKSVKNWRSRTTFGSWDVEKVHAVVARSTFRSQKCKKLRALSLFWREDVEKVDID